MLIGYCDSCRYLDLINEKSECNCPRCSRTMRSLGISSEEWNLLSDEDKYNPAKIVEKACEIQRRNEEEQALRIEKNSVSINNKISASDIDHGIDKDVEDVTETIRDGLEKLGKPSDSGAVDNLSIEEAYAAFAVGMNLSKEEVKSGYSKETDEDLKTEYLEITSREEKNSFSKGRNENNLGNHKQTEEKGEGETHMFKIKCKKDQSQELKDAFMRAFAEMCLSGIDYYQEDSEEMKQAIDNAIEVIDGVFCGFEDAEDGFSVEFDSVYEIGYALAEELLDENSFTDLFTNDSVGATGRWIADQIHQKYPDVGIDARIVYDDGHHDSMVESVSIQNGEVVSKWEEGDEDEDD